MDTLIQHPAPGGRSLFYRGGSITFTLEVGSDVRGKAWLRSNIGYASVRHMEIIRKVEEGLTPLSRDWHDLPMTDEGDGRFTLSLPLLQVGRFEAKAYFVAADSDTILWPEGENSVLKVEPAESCAGNTMYTAFVRQFGKARFDGAVSREEQSCVEALEDSGYAVIPRSGTFRDLIGELDFIVGTLRCGIVQLLPVHPTPTTYARMGRFGSPFAVMDLFKVDPSLAEFDRQTTPLQQFGELADEVHRRRARLFLDIPINHTGWASHLQMKHPEWFHRNDDDSFMSPGAWGVLWEDLSKLDYTHHELWKYMANVFLFWCRNGVDGFRCDAGYKIPFDAWEYIIAKVRMEFPDTIFMLEGLGGYKHVTEHLLADSGMNWAYSEIFQNYDRGQIDGYLPQSMAVSESIGNLIHFSETHDNLRLAATSHLFARLRTAFCALSSHNGAFGFANGVEWYATEKINVHNAHSLNWGAETNMVDWIRRIHAIMEDHPSFHANATVRLITSGHQNTTALLRTDVSGRHRLLVLANHNTEQEVGVEWYGHFGEFTTDLLTGEAVQHADAHGPLKPGQVLCLTDEPVWVERIDGALEKSFQGAAVAEEQRIRAVAMELYHHFNALEQMDIGAFLENPKGICEQLAGQAPIVTCWNWPQDSRRTVMLPPGHFLLIQAPSGFVAELMNGRGQVVAHQCALRQDNENAFVLFTPMETPEEHQDLTLRLSVFEDDGNRHIEAPIMLLCDGTHVRVESSFPAGETENRDRYAICTNRHGALAQVRIGWAELRSKYDGLLAANLNPDVPVDRHMLLTRCRGWIVYRDYSTELSYHCQNRFEAADDGRVIWDFTMPVGQGRLIPLRIELQMHPDTNAIRLAFIRMKDGDNPELLKDHLPVSLILRPDIEDRCNHAVTKAFAGPENHWPKAVQAERSGFVFTPANDRKLTLSLKGGTFHHEPEWHYQVDHPVDRERGIDGSTDLFSPGYFRMDLSGGETAVLIAGEGKLPTVTSFHHKDRSAKTVAAAPCSITKAMRRAMEQFIVKRDEYLTVIAGYPWFLDWGRDTLICLRGIIAAGLLKEAEHILLQFARFEKGGTIPNMIRGNDDNNRETSDAPLWLFVACRDLMDARDNMKLLKASCGERTLGEVLVSIAEGFISGTENGISFDPESGLIFSPSHFTWMDTNYPAGTPREGYPIEIQALWYHALTLLAKMDPAGRWTSLADQVAQSIDALYRLESGGYTYLADHIAAQTGTAARHGAVDDALRPNQLLAITFGAVSDISLCRGILSACEQLLIPGAIRTLADRPVLHPAPVYNSKGELLNDPQQPYWGHYAGDEDTRRKPAYHNGTAWTWPFPSYAEALVMVYGQKAQATSLALLGSASSIIHDGCIGHSPEVLDGDTPHTQRGCGAQAWGATELFRVFRKLEQTTEPTTG